MNEQELLRRAMSILGSRKSKAKADAARRNGVKGGRPKKPTDSLRRAKRSRIGKQAQNKA